eukprot:s1564_g18.t1
MQQFRTSLKFHNASFRYCIGGFPVDSTSAGPKWKGVAVLSKHPTRSVPHSWPAAIETSARAMLAASLVQDTWVQGAVIYGEPDGHLHPDHRQHNEALLQHAAGHVCHLAKGYRYVAGDFNETCDSLQAFHLLHDAGFRDLQTLALERFGLPIKNTCKNKTRKDFCFISPELQDLLQSVQVLDDIWPDHVVLQGRFRAPSSSIPHMQWFVPQEFPWPSQFDVQPDFWHVQSGSATERYAKLWQHLETQATPNVPFRIPRRAYGRGQTLQPHATKVSTQAPLKAPRKGEFAPHFHGVSRRHVLWVRQVRRLQAFVNLCKSEKPATEGHLAALWRSICSAKGFDPCFSAWWLTCNQCVHGAPAQCPIYPPDLSVATAMFDSLVMATRQLEAQLIRESRQYAKLRREQNPNAVFRDIGEPLRGGPDVLTRAATSVIATVNPEESCLILDRAQDWTDQPILCNGTVLPVIHAEADCVWVEFLDNVRPGLPVSQLQLKGTLPDLSQEFLATWKQRWHRHKDIPPSRWNAIVQFAKQHLPQSAYQWPSLDAPKLQAAIASKKSKTTGGLDGVSLQDIKRLPLGALQNFCAMYSTAEMTGEWPVQVVSGRVSSLAKVSTPSSALDFRPITVLGLLYRCWSSYHAHAALRKIDDQLPRGLLGSRPNKYAGQIWSSLLWDIEQAYADNCDLGGVIADIQKAFNYVPRFAVMEICLHVGMPASVILGWTGALVTMQRRFQIRSHITEPLTSTTGVPEGCALSCLAMMMLDWSLHMWFEHFLPLSRPLTFVDDWQVVTLDSHQIDRIMDGLFHFADMVDMLIDAKKTYSWSVTGTGRAALRAQGFTVATRGRNLGAHVQFTRQHTNSVQVDRLSQLQALWPRLRLSPSPYRQKLRAVLMTAWPKGLHAIAATSLSLQWFQNLRSGVMKGLQAEGAGVNSHLHLGLVETPLHDPQFWSIMATFRFMRECACPEQVRQILVDIVSGFSSIPDNSITSTLAMRLQVLGWHVCPTGRLCDELGTFCLFAVSAQELHARATEAWTRVIASEVHHRKGFEACHRVDAEHTRHWVRLLNASDAALVRKILNGAHFTQDVLCFSQPDLSPLCPYCDSTDSRYHRFWQCPFFDAQRANFPTHMWQLLPTLPEVLTAYGWSLKPRTLHRWQMLLTHIEDAPVVPVVQGLSEVLHFFTDGSCINQHDHECRFASWAVVRADPAARSIADCAVHDAGPLPGLLQSAYRAEVYGVLRVLQSCQNLPCKVCLWVDCAAVVKRMKKILLGRCPKPNSPHADLWIEIFHLVMAYPVGCIGIFKVAAHRNESEARDAMEAWCFRNNSLADRAAVRANFARSHEFWSFYTLHVDACNHIRAISRSVQQVQLAVSRAHVRASEDLTPAPVEPYSFPDPRPWKSLPPLQTLPAAAARWYGEHMVRLMVSWFWQGVDDSAPICWVSHFQLYVDFQLSSGSVGPIHRKKWFDGSDLPLVGLMDISFKKRTRWFTKVLKETLRHMGIFLETGFGRPASEAIAMHTGLCAVPWPSFRLGLVDQWISSRLNAAVTRGGRSLECLPLAKRDCQFEQVFLTSASF